MTRPRHEAIDRNDLLVHEWRVTQLPRLGYRGHWPKLPPTTSTGTRSPSWCGVAARDNSRSKSSAEAAPMATSLPLHPVTDHAAWAQVARYPRCADSSLHPGQWSRVSAEPAYARHEP